MASYKINQQYRKRRRSPALKILSFVGFAVALFSLGFIYLQPEPTVAGNNQPLVLTDQPKLTAPMPWPAYGQSAYGVRGNGVLATSEDSAKQVPMASLAKVITALAILEKKPLKPGEQGPMLTLNEEDVASYGYYLNNDGAAVGVEAGEQISQYQAMQAMLMASANNMADSLARWAFGSVEEYNKYANQMVKSYGLSNTNVADASGFSANSTSTAHNLAQLGVLYMQNPVLREIAASGETTLPVGGAIQNYNSVINKEGLIGIKVGNTDEAGRCFILANVRKSPTGQEEIVSVSVVMGAENLQIAMKDAEAIIKAGDSGYDQLNQR